MVVAIDMGFLTFRHESASAYLDFLADDMALLASVKSMMRGLGDGNGLMRAVCAYADANGLAVVLYVGTYELDDDAVGEPLTDEQLIKWYQKFGFKLQFAMREEHPQMVRYPAHEKVRVYEETE